MRVVNANNNGQLLRPALGEQVPFGTLYDARTDQFLSQSLLREGGEIFKASSAIPTNQLPEVNVIFHGSYQAKFNLLNIGADLGASILAKLIKPKGASMYLDVPQQRDDILHAAIHHKVISAREKFNVVHLRNQAAIDWEALTDLDATHFVVGIEWGIQSIVSVQHAVSSSADHTVVEAQFRTKISNFKSAIESDTPIAQDSFTHGPTDKDMPLEITTYSDVSAECGVMVETLEKARSELSLIPMRIEKEYSNRGRPITYTLLPISFLGMIAESEERFGAAMTPISLETENLLVHLFDDFSQSYQKLHKNYEYISQHPKYSSERLRKEVESKVSNLKCAFQSFEQAYSEALVSVRSGKDKESLLRDLYAAYTSNETSPVTLANTTDRHVAKIKFILEATRMGATYTNTEDPIIDLIGNKDAYVFSFTDTALNDSKSWNKNATIFQDLLGHQSPDTLYIISDDDAVGNVSPYAYISFYEKGDLVSGDVLEEQTWLVKQCFVQYATNTLEDRDIKRPLKRRLVTMPCPSQSCSRSRICEWKCFNCRTPVEFGFTDKYIYCDCGRSSYENFSFRCDHPSHGGSFEKCNPQHVLSQLKNLGDSENINILILGETGVGKSTFINAFVNYLTFKTLDEAKAEEGLHWVIPCSFSTQIMDRNRPDGAIEQIKIQVGARDDEHDGSKGASATQRTTVYPITIGKRTIRLIDTPGIGDTRGIQYDKKNMADILSTLSSYDHLHGILILVKSNNARLTVTFNFCMKELLTHLHRSAASNMAFGFTNTRISNYTPGDTFGPLSTLIQNHSDIGLSLTTHTTYCFDSESFRYLAAFKNGTVMENEEDFRRSWEHSRTESLRLIDYFKSKTPHKVQSTISLNGARQLIASLTKPMAEMSALIKANISMLVDKIKELTDSRITGEKLRERLYIEKKHLRSKPLDMPRTVCKEKDCIELRDDGGGVIATVYKTHCHSICFLDDVEVDQVAHPSLIGCAAFAGSNYCRKCTHHWQSHLHVRFELEEYMATVTDTEVERQIQANADDVTLRERVIENLNNLIAEYKEEHAKLQNASARFGVFLKKYSITPYNDATLEYLDMLIKDEEMKVQVGGNRKRLDDLLEDRRMHEELVDILTRNMDNKYQLQYQVLNEAGVENLVSQLYGLKHFGANLKTVRNDISTAHEAANRERPFRVNRGWASKTPRRAGRATRDPHDTATTPQASKSPLKTQGKTKSQVRKFFGGFPARVLSMVSFNNKSDVET
ncbi:hypothetical protein F5Y00DRAFT_268504 [Daldinia vernicosa]|uniref:uncharacterized protein n=1 Tax=Daldinia vernicosa TaxID=114800 RepID=UPI0020082164|nr:uncharacterized protein F5Y00DRAFT_268504 [Daldinia vernicosa]KAI0850382.1 hypothetical protein F5Y00DRAFT_268504 [Daldinia vernicosa]